MLFLECLLKQTTAGSFYNLKKEFERSDRTTLYRTLKTLEEKGIKPNIKDGAEAVKFAGCEAECKEGIHDDMHLHFYCTNCKELFCLPKATLPEVMLPYKVLLQ